MVDLHKESRQEVKCEYYVYCRRLEHDEPVNVLKIFLITLLIVSLIGMTVFAIVVVKDYKNSEEILTQAGYITDKYYRKSGENGSAFYIKVYLEDYDKELEVNISYNDFNIVRLGDCVFINIRLIGDRIMGVELM